jgi:hypothetical protein
MTHKEFVEKYKLGEIKVFVNRAKALRAINNGYLPKNYYWAHTFWSWIWFLCLPFGIIVLFFKWWIGAALLFASIWLGEAVKRSAMEFVLQHTLENEQFFKFAIETGILEFEEEKNLLV